MIDELGAWLRDIDNIPHAKTIHELKTFTRNINGRMSGSPHDDCVMSLGIAVQGLKYARTEPGMKDVEPARVPGSFAWWEKRLDRARKGESGLSPVV
jgi:hypothetical protein